VVTGLIEEFADERNVATGIEEETLEHTADGVWPEGFLFVPHWATVGGAGGDGLARDGNRMVNEKFQADVGRSGGMRGTGAEGRSLFGQKEGCTVYGGAGDAVVFAGGPEEFCAKGRLLESDSRFRVGDKHRRYLSWHCRLESGPIHLGAAEARLR